MLVENAQSSGDLDMALLRFMNGTADKRIKEKRRKKQRFFLSVPLRLFDKSNIKNFFVFNEQHQNYLSGKRNFH